MARDSFDNDRRFFRQAFRALLWRTRPTALQARVDDLIDEVQRRAAALSVENAFDEVYRDARAGIVNELVDAGAINRADRADAAPPTNSKKTRELLDRFVPQRPVLEGPEFHCDAGLCGLARLVRAAGYDAAFWPGIDDDVLLEKVLEGTAILLTNDALLMRRGVITRGVIPALLVPIALKKREQFAHVVDKLDLPLGTPRCMSCGGRLDSVDKLVVRDRIPPKTFPWCDDYYLCERCDKLFWRGTHWQRIHQCLTDVARR